MRSSIGVTVAGIAAAFAIAAPTAGAATASPRVVGGSTVGNPGWVAYVLADFGDGSTGQCGGQLVASQWVLTAAHCVVDEAGRPLAASAMRTWVGHDRVSETSNANAQAVDRVVVDPSYSAQTNSGDLALLHLAAADPHEPVALGSAPDPVAGSAAQVLGWGVSDVLFQRTSDTLQQVSLTIADGAACAQEYGSSFDAASMICAGAARNQDSCSGDSGGPLASSPTTGAATLLGTVDYGSAFCGDGSPSVYQRVTGGAGLTFLASTIPTAAIVPSPSPAARNSRITLGATATGLTDPTFSWDLNGDGVYGEATGASAPLALGTGSATVGVRVAGADGQRAARRLTITPAATTVTASVPARVTEDHTLRLALATDGPGSGTVTAKLVGAARAAGGSADVPATSGLDVRIPGDHVWRAPRRLTIALTGTDQLGLAQTTLTTTLVDDDTPRLRIDRVRRSGARRVTTTFRAPGAGTVTLRVSRAGRTLARRTLRVSGTRAARAAVALPAARAADLARGGVRVSGTWTSSQRPRASARARRTLSS